MKPNQDVGEGVDRAAASPPQGPHSHGVGELEAVLANGVRLFWREFGNPKGSPTLWIHGGSGEDSSMMVRDLEPFYDELRVILPDTRGHGRSDRFERVEDYRWAAKCGDMVALLDHLGIDRAVWGGNSMGAALSLWAGAYHGARVRAILDISGPPEKTRVEEVEFWAEHRASVLEGRFSDYFDANLARRSGPEVLAKLKARPERYAEVVEQLHRHSVASFLALLDETNDRPDWLAACERIACPTLVIGGGRDIWPDEAQTRRVAATIPNSSLHIIADGGHFPNRTHRAEVQALITSFLRENGILKR